MRRTRTALAVALMTLTAACGEPGVDDGAQASLGSDTTAGVPTTLAPLESTTTATSTTTTTLAPTTAGEFGDRVPLQVVNDAGRPGQLFDTTAVAVSDQGVIAVASDAGALATFDDEGTWLAANPDAHDGQEIVGLGFVDERLLTVAEDGTVHTWDEPAVDLAEPSASSALAMGAIATAAIGNGWLAVGAVNAEVALISTTDEGTVGEAVWEHRLTARAQALAVAPGASMAAAAPALAIGTSGGEVLLYDVELSDDPIDLPAPSGEATSLTFVDGGDALLVAGEERPVVIDIATGERRDDDTGTTPSGTPITAVAGWWVPGRASSRTATAGTDPLPETSDATSTTAAGDGAVVVVRLGATGPSEAPRPTRGFQSAVRFMAFLPDGSGLVIADGEHVVLQLVEG